MIIGTIKLSTVGYDHDGWLLCDGRAFAITTNPALHAVIKNNYGGDESKQLFNVPDFRGRVAIGFNEKEPAAQYRLGATGGKISASASCGVPLPAHTHAATFRATPAPVQIKVNTDGNAARIANPSNAYLAVPVTKANLPVVLYNAGNYPGDTLGGVSGGDGGAITEGTVTLDPEGEVNPTATASFNDIRQPFLALNYFICAFGEFPTTP